MRIIFFVLITYCVLGALSCTQTNIESTHDQNYDLQLDSLYSFELKSHEIISRIDDHHGVKINSKGERFLIVDKGKNQILVTDTLGNVQVIVGQTGRGPREFLSVDGLTFINDESFMVYDKALALMKMFRIDGSLIGSFRPSMDGYYFSSPDMVVHDGIIYAGILESDYVPYAQTQNYEKMSESKILIAIDTSGNDIKKYGTYDSLTPESKDYVQFAVVGLSNNWKKVFINQLDSPIIQAYDLENKSFEVFSESVPDHYVKAKEFISPTSTRNKIREMSLGRTYAERIVPLRNHLFKSMDIITEEWNITRDPKTKTNILVVYNNEGRIVAEEKLDGRRLFGGHGDRLYFLKDNNPDNFTIEVATYTLEQK